MTLRYEARIEVYAGDKNKSVFKSVYTDNEFYPENPTETKVFLNDKDNSGDKNFLVTIRSNEISHFRANLNSILRLVQTSYESVNSAKRY